MTHIFHQHRCRFECAKCYVFFLLISGYQKGKMMLKLFLKTKNQIFEFTEHPNLYPTFQVFK